MVVLHSVGPLKQYLQIDFIESSVVVHSPDFHACSWDRFQLTFDPEQDKRESEKDGYFNESCYLNG